MAVAFGSGLSHNLVIIPNALMAWQILRPGLVGAPGTPAGWFLTQLDFARARVEAMQS
jgi:hypothetical protein